MQVTDILVLFFTLLLGGAMKGATGIGVPIIAVPVLAAYFGLHFAVGIILLPNLFSNGWQVWRFRKERPPRHLVFSILAGASTGIFIGVFLLVSLPVSWLNMGVAVAILIFVLSRLAKPDWRLSQLAGRILAPPAMILAGIMQGATGISAPVLMMYLSSLRMERPTFIFSVSLAFFVSAVAHIPAMVAAGLFGPEQFVLSLLALGPVMAGIPLGDRIARFMSAALFDRVILLFLIALAAKLGYSAFAI